MAGVLQTAVGDAARPHCRSVLILLVSSLLAVRTVLVEVENSLIPPDLPNKQFSRQDIRLLLRENIRLRKRVAALEFRGAPSTVYGKPVSATTSNASVVLTRARFEAVAGKERQIILSFVNHARIDFAATWAAHLRRSGATNWLIGATDPDALVALMRSGTPCFDLHTNLPESEWTWGSSSFHSLGPTKVRLIYTVIGWGLELVITDIDALVLRAPFPFMARWPDAGFLTTSDHLANTTDDNGLEAHAATGSAYNIGYMLFRPRALPLVQEWLKAVAANPLSAWDQGEFNRIVHLGASYGRHVAAGLSDTRLFPAYHGRVVGGVLPLALFSGGHNFFVAQMAARQNVQPYSVHTTFQYGGADGKRHRLREAMLWEVGAGLPSLDMCPIPASSRPSRTHSPHLRPSTLFWHVSHSTFHFQSFLS